MSDLNSFLELVWDGILSRDTDRITATYLSLDEVNKKTVEDHLAKMSTEPDWHQEQVISADAALQVIKTLKRENHEY